MLSQLNFFFYSWTYPSSTGFPSSECTMVVHPLPQLHLHSYKYQSCYWLNFLCSFKIFQHFSSFSVHPPIDLALVSLYHQHHSTCHLLAVCAVASVSGYLHYLFLIWPLFMTSCWSLSSNFSLDLWSGLNPTKLVS